MSDDLVRARDEALAKELADWTCMVCLRWRPDSAISVAHRPAPDYITARIPGQIFNVRYCNDRPECAAYAYADGPWTGSPPRAVDGHADG